MILKIFIPLVFVWFIVCPQIAQASDHPVSFTAPKSWELIESKVQQGANVVLYKIADNRTKDGRDIPSNVLIQYYPLPKGVSFSSVDGIVYSRMKNATLIVSGKDGDNWKTYIYVTYDEKQQLIAFYRIGIDKGFIAEMLFCFPHITKSNNQVFSVLTLNEVTIPNHSMAGIYCNPSDVKEMVNQFNEFCSTFKIRNTNIFDTRVKFISPPPDAKYFRKNDGTKK